MDVIRCDLPMTVYSCLTMGEKDSFLIVNKNLAEADQEEQIQKMTARYEEIKENEKE